MQLRPKVRIPNFNRLKDLAKLLKVDDKKLVEALCIRHKKWIHSNFDGIWHRFRTMKEVIIPYTTAQKFATTIGKTGVLEETEKDLRAEYDSHISSCIPSQRNAMPVVILLGHYNHGKTTLLDSLTSTTVVDSEPGFITQEIRTISVSIPRAPAVEEGSFLFADLLKKTLDNRMIKPPISRDIRPDRPSSEVFIPIHIDPAFAENPQGVDPMSASSDFHLRVTIIDTPGQDVFFRMRNYAG